MCAWLRGLQVQSAPEVVDNTVLHKYSRLYNERIDELRRSLAEEGDAAAGTAAQAPPPSASTASASGGQGSSFFTFDDADVKGATPPAPAPTGADEWRRPFWLMRILRQSMLHGGYLTPDGTIFVPRRVWMQKGARFTALAAKTECATCLIAELQRSGGVDFRSVAALQEEVDRLCVSMDDVQNSLHRLLPYVPEARTPEAPGHAIGKLTERFKGLAKTLDRTAARLGALPTKCPDPSEYVSALVKLFDAAGVVESWIEHYATATPAPPASLLERLHRCATFLYEVVCAFVIQDLDGLIQRHMRKASAHLIRAPAAD